MQKQYKKRVLRAVFAVLTLRPSTLAGVAVTARKTSSSDIPAAVSFDITCEGTNNPHDFSHIHLIEKPAGLGILWMLLPYRRQVVWRLARWDLAAPTMIPKATEKVKESDKSLLAKSYLAVIIGGDRVGREATLNSCSCDG